MDTPSDIGTHSIENTPELYEFLTTFLTLSFYFFHPRAHALLLSEHRLQRLKSHITVLKRGEIILVLKGTLIKARRTAQTPAHRETIPVSQYSLQGGELELSDWLVPMEVIRSYG